MDWGLFFFADFFNKFSASVCGAMQMVPSWKESFLQSMLRLHLSQGKLWERMTT